MDYGYQLLRHVIVQVFGNLAAAARITIIPILLGYAICGAIFYALIGPLLVAMFTQDPTYFEQSQLDPAQAEADGIDYSLRFALAYLICLPIFTVFYSWAAVGWHRYVLLEELPAGYTAKWNLSIIRSYVWAVIRIFFVMIPIGLAAVLILGILVSSVPSLWVTNFIVGGIGIGFLWLLTRFGLILPAAAVGTYMKLGESWKTTAPVSGAILLPIIVIPLVVFILSTLTGLLGIIGLVIYAIVTWLQVLVNLAMMTTLYGNLIEGRQLN